jgi:sorbitol/mannitol transport system substrate-binding protein
MNNYGPPGASSNGFNENLALFQQGKCGMWIDATVAASFVTNPKDSTVADKVGFALAPDNGPRQARQLALGLERWRSRPARRRKRRKKFIEWATSEGVHSSSSPKEGWANVPPGTRTSLYENPEYQRRSFAKMTLDSINSADPTKPTVDPVPYVGVQFVAIPEFQGIGTAVGPAVLGGACRAR